ncbi:uncharacterized protein K489DRAFT_375682 [Dissoconium aciculare CBS 342.82]|uniref:Secreted protein n=1 Tax=Dissoconium aciculare CBS 342.82 TaxID=1314786 RepID=A0A6J3MKS0_9PEZI|nr:uncharacterized protein K489DRAFT_375682 [Dissoconium aciculare CBS 342.82]KAF1827567.1 hypothetical protein K489DRAFT_375682 [Dissoconium aciculare CBS 342.82]
MWGWGCLLACLFVCLLLMLLLQARALKTEDSSSSFLLFLCTDVPGRVDNLYIGDTRQHQDQPGKKNHWIPMGRLRGARRRTRTGNSEDRAVCVMSESDEGKVVRLVHEDWTCHDAGAEGKIVRAQVRKEQQQGACTPGQGRKKPLGLLPRDHHLQYLGSVFLPW